MMFKPDITKNSRPSVPAPTSEVRCTPVRARRLDVLRRGTGDRSGVAAVEFAYGNPPERHF
jgi:hypothetical protein